MNVTTTDVTVPNIAIIMIVATIIMPLVTLSFFIVYFLKYFARTNLYLYIFAFPDESNIKSLFYLSYLIQSRVHAPSMSDLKSIFHDDDENGFGKAIARLTERFPFGKPISVFLERRNVAP